MSTKEYEAGSLGNSSKDRRPRATSNNQRKKQGSVEATLLSGRASGSQVREVLVSKLRKIFENESRIVSDLKNIENKINQSNTQNTSIKVSKIDVNSKYKNSLVSSSKKSDKSN